MDNRTLKVWASSLVAVICIQGVSALATPPRYAVSLPPVPAGGGVYEPTAINDGGLTAGRIDYALSDDDLAFFDGNEVQILGMFGRQGGQVTCMSNAGHVAGWTQQYDPNAPAGTLYPVLNEAYVWRDGEVTFLGALGLPGSRFDGAWAYGVNDAGWVVGTSSIAEPNEYGEAIHHGFVWKGNAIEDLGCLPGMLQSDAYGINNAGQIVGHSSSYDAGRRACLWDEMGVHELPSLGTGTSVAHAINNAGQIVGQYFAAPYDEQGTEECRGILWDEGQPIDLGSLGGDTVYVSDINDHGQIVGASKTLGGSYHAFLWDEGVMYDLNDLAVGSDWVFDRWWSGWINNDGEIIVVGRPSDLPNSSENYQFLMLSPVPEPGGALVLCLGLALLRRRK